MVACFAGRIKGFYNIRDNAAAGGDGGDGGGGGGGGGSDHE